LASLYEALPAFAPGRDKATLERFFRDMNRYVAENNLSTFYKAMLILMTPDRLFDILPRLWTTYFQGVEVTVTRGPGAKRGTCRVHGVGHLIPGLAPGAVGWLELAFGKVGGRLSSYEEGWRSGKDRVDPLVFHLDWS
jgi:hypothetical protein